MKGSFKRYFIKLLAVLTVLSSGSAYAYTCPATVDNSNPAVTTIKAGNGAEFLIEDKQIKMVLPTAFDKVYWKTANLSGGAAKIRGVIKNGKAEKIISEQFAVKINGMTHWYIVYNTDIAGGSGSWVVVANLNGNFSCSAASDYESVKIDESQFSQYNFSRAKLWVIGADYIYSRLGL